MATESKRLVRPFLPALPVAKRRRGRLVLPILIAALVLLPVAILASEMLHPSLEMWEQLWATILPRMLLNTLLLILGVGVGTFVLGVGLAWLMVGYRFPGRPFFERAMLLPLAVPSFVMGFVYMATFDFAGPVQTALRRTFGADLRLPDIRSGWGAVMVLSLVLYPYVYLLARAAFREQAARTVEAARVMGYTRAQSFFRLILPLARPSLAAGTVLAIMEAMTDFATVRFFSFPTVSEGIVRVWEGRLDRAGASELALLLLGIAVVLLLVERAMRGQRRYYQAGGRSARPTRYTLTGWRAWLPVAVCSGILFAAFVLPVGQLALWTIEHLTRGLNQSWSAVFGTYVLNTFLLASVAAGITVLLALIVAVGVRMRGGHFAKAVARLATLGYALPGAVIAAGILMTLAPIDHTLNRVAKEWGFTPPGLVLTGSIVGLIYAYVVRFMSVAYNSVEASLEKVKPSMEQAARTMGARLARIVWRIHGPLVSHGMAAGMILVFVDAMKELPATLMLRPFGMDTLAVWSYMAASESFWQEAALPALTILLVGLIPVSFLMRIGNDGHDVSTTH